MKDLSKAYKFRIQMATILIFKRYCIYICFQTIEIEITGFVKTILILIQE